MFSIFSVPEGSFFVLTVNFILMADSQHVDRSPLLGCEGTAGEVIHNIYLYLIKFQFTYLNS